MSFFDEVPLPPPPEREPHFRAPPWMGPADDVIPATVPLDVVLARTDEAFVALGGIRAYDEGFALEVRTLVRDGDEHDPFHFGAGARRDPDVLRLGIQFADGRRAVANADLLRPSEVGGDVVFSGQGGGGGGAAWQREFWIWPLPPPGPVTFVCAWPRFGIEESRTEVDGGLIADAARRALVVWPDHRPPLWTEVGEAGEDDEDGPAIQRIR